MKILDLNGVKIKGLGHDSFRIDFDKKIIYIDPYEVNETDKGDLIMITHGHYDHCSIADLIKLTKSDTVIVATPDVTSKLSGKVHGGQLKLVKPGDSVEAKGIKIKAVAAYNLNKPFHPKGNDWVGFIFEVNNIKMYHAGDTDYIPEMENIVVDIAFLPVSGTYVMNWEEAVQAAKKIMPKIAIPMHYGKIVGERKDALKFAEKCTFCKVTLLD